MRLVSSLVFLAFLGACATLTEEQCRGGDWSGIGYNDGINGRSGEYISNHFDACSELGITPDIGAWQSGREQGLLRYCTPENAYITGRNGGNFNQVCPINDRSTLNAAYDWGAEYYDISQEIRILTEEQFQLELAIAAILALPAPTPADMAQLAQMQSRVRLIDRQLWRLENRLERYEVPPLLRL